MAVLIPSATVPRCRNCVCGGTFRCRKHSGRQNVSVAGYFPKLTVVDVRVGQLAADPNGAGIDIVVRADSPAIISRLDVIQLAAEADINDPSLPSECGGASNAERLRLKPVRPVVGEDGRYVVAEQISSSSGTRVAVTGRYESIWCFAGTSLTLRPQLALEGESVRRLFVEIPSKLEVTRSKVDPILVTQGFEPTSRVIAQGPRPGVSRELLRRWRSMTPGKTFDTLVWPWEAPYREFADHQPHWALILLVAVGTNDGECAIHGVDLNNHGAPLTDEQTRNAVDGWIAGQLPVECSDGDVTD